jgi:hypothetical protein
MVPFAFETNRLDGSYAISYDISHTMSYGITEVEE